MEIICKHCRKPRSKHWTHGNYGHDWCKSGSGTQANPTKRFEPLYEIGKHYIVKAFRVKPVNINDVIIYMGESETKFNFKLHKTGREYWFEKSNVENWDLQPYDIEKADTIGNNRSLYNK